MSSSDWDEIPEEVIGFEATKWEEHLDSTRRTRKLMREFARDLGSNNKLHSPKLKSAYRKISPTYSTGLRMMTLQEDATAVTFDASVLWSIEPELISEIGGRDGNWDSGNNGACSNWEGGNTGATSDWNSGGDTGANGFDGGAAGFGGADDQGAAGDGAANDNACRNCGQGKQFFQCPPISANFFDRGSYDARVH